MAISIDPLHPLFAARASGIDLSRPIDAADFAAIKAAVDTYGVLYKVRRARCLLN